MPDQSLEKTTLSYDKLNNAPFEGAKQLSDGTLRLNSDQCKDGFAIQAGYNRLAEGNEKIKTVFDIVEKDGHQIPINKVANLIIKPQEIRTDGKGGGFVVENPNPGSTMVIWLDHERITVDEDFPITINKPGSFYIEIGEGKAIKITRGSLSNEVTVKNFTYDEYMTGKGQLSRIVDSDNRADNQQKDGLKPMFPATLRAGSEGHAVNLKNHADKRDFDFHKDPMVISTSEYSPPSDDKAYMVVKLVDEAGKQLDPLKYNLTVALTWNPETKRYVIQNFGKDTVSWVDPIVGGANRLEPGQSTSSSGEVQFIVNDLDVKVTTIGEDSTNPQKLRFDTSRR